MNFKTIFKSFKNRDMLKRILIILGIILIYRFLAHVPIPLADPVKMKAAIESAISSSDLGGFMNLISGGALTNFSIILVGLGPFITASIVIQLLTKAVPKLEELHNDGETGRRKLNQWTRMLTIPLAVLQSIAYIFILRQNVLAANTADIGATSMSEWIVAVTAMTAGSVLLMWLGELVTEQGLGNGISTLIFASIISQLPASATTIWNSIVGSGGSISVFGWFDLPINGYTLAIIAGFLALVLFILYVLVKINEAQRIITINYAKRVHGNSSYGGIKSILPIKLIAAGVIPVIFAVAFLSLPSFIGQVLRSADASSAVANKLVLWFSAPNPGSFTGETWESFIYPVAYFLLVVGFTYFYTSIVFNSKEISENLQKQGGFIEGVRPGKNTATYLSRIVNHLNLFGSLALGLIAMLPFVADLLLYFFTGQPNAQLSISGTGLLIVVTVALESLRQLNSRALMITYDDYKNEPES
ncbi:MAG: preprotein translocase subunit SecY [Candidatus Nomurabacteria bacterium]|jgi:preprotein translocase subunit SecY|nr:preprotein translocase subunit SecY [Candidatus Nomurabacteria bacterium]